MPSVRTKDRQRASSDPVGDLPLVSIVVPCHNAERYLAEALDSILAQTYPRLEILCMDDASSDRTPEIIESYGDQVTHHRQPENRGIYDNVDTGIERAKGDLIATYHADDIYLPQIVERQVDFFQRHPEVGAVFAKDILVDADNVEYDRLRLPPEFAENSLIAFPTLINSLLKRKNPYLVCPTAMARSSVYREIGGYRQHLFRNSSDLDCWIRIAERHPIAIVDEYLMRYRHSQHQSSRRYHKLRTEPENFFAIMDHHLEGAAGSVATAEALQAYEAHRAVDRILITVNRYILGDPGGFRRSLKELSMRDLLSSSAVERGRLSILYLLLQILAKLPHSQGMATLFHRHWYTRRIHRAGKGFWQKLRLTLADVLKGQGTRDRGGNSA